MSCRLGNVTVPNPFRNQTPTLKPQQRFRYFFPGVILVPLRVSLMLLSYASAYTFAKIATTGVSMKRIEEKPLDGYRRVAQQGVRFSLRMFLFSLGFHRIRRFGLENLAKNKADAPILVAGPHIAPFEAFALFCFHSCGFVAADSNYKMPIVGVCMRATQQVRLVRGDASSRNKIKQIIKDRAEHPTFPQVGIFPTGTTTNDSSLISFKPGAFEPGLPVQPVLARYRWRETTGIDPSWAGSSVGLPLLVWRLMSQWQNELELHYMPVYVPSEFEKKNPVYYANNVRMKMAKELGVPTTEHGLDDMLLQAEAVKLGVGDDSDTSGLELQRVKQMFAIDLSDIKIFLQSLHAMKKKGAAAGSLRYDQFLSGLGLPDSEILRQVFLEISEMCHHDEENEDADTDGVVSGVKASNNNKNNAAASLCDRPHLDISQVEIDLEEFLNACLAISSADGTEQKLREIFDAIDSDGNRVIRVEEMKAALCLVAPDVTRAQVLELIRKFRTGSVSVLGREEIDFVEFASFLRNNPLTLRVLSKMVHERGMIAKVMNEARRTLHEARDKPVNEE